MGYLFVNRPSLWIITRFLLSRFTHNFRLVPTCFDMIMLVSLFLLLCDSTTRFLQSWFTHNFRLISMCFDLIMLVGIFLLLWDSTTMRFLLSWFSVNKNLQGSVTLEIQQVHGDLIPRKKVWRSHDSAKLFF